MAVHKKTAKPAAKKAASKKPAAKPAATAKKAAKPVAKSAKPVAKATIKPAAKPVAKTPAKPIAKKTVKAPAEKKAIAKPADKKAPVKAIASKVSVVPKIHSKKEDPKAAKTAVKTSQPSAIPVKPEQIAKPAATSAASAKKPAAKATVVPKTPRVSRSSISTKDIKVIPAKPVALPKFATKTSRKYHPDFTQSVLDQPKHDLGSPIVRYTDTELKEFKDLIIRKLDAAKKELTYLQGLITRKDELGGDESENRYMTMEDGSLSMEREQLSQMASRQITFIDHLEKALMRIENKTYGICRVTGKLIDKARLRAVPHATLSIEAKMGIVK